MTSMVTSQIGSITQNEVEKYLQHNVDFAKEYVVSFLTNSPEFTEEFFITYADMELFQKWYDQKVNLRLNRPASYREVKRLNSIPYTAASDESMLLKPDGENRDDKYNTKTLPNMANLFKYFEFGDRRRSEPFTNDVNKINNSDEPLDTIKEDSSLRCLSRSNSVASNQPQRYRTSSLLSNIDENNNNDKKKIGKELRFIPSEPSHGKPFLRKAQSEPTYNKKNLSHLIRSSVYSGAGNMVNNQINIENHLGLRESGQASFLVEILKDISKDLSLSLTCYKILKNLGFMLNVEKASIYLVKQDSDLLQLFLRDVSITDSVRKDSLSMSLSKAEEVPLGKGIIGKVAMNGCSLIANNIRDVSDVMLCY